MATHTHILIAEDDPILREVYLRKFKQEGYAIRVAENGEVALQMIREEQPDLLICDIMMPKRDGWWVLDQLPKATRPFPVIMLTNLEDDDTRARCEKLADGYFVKSRMELATLVSMTKTLIRKHSK